MNIFVSEPLDGMAGFRNLVGIQPVSSAGDLGKGFIVTWREGKGYWTVNNTCTQSFIVMLY